MKNFIDILKNNPNGAYDFISNNYYKMNKEELRDIVKELLYAIHSHTTEAEHDWILEAAAEELEEQYAEN